ncbi:MAG: anthranilate phosphoribosyltransferase, partial [Acidimicrobiia bacterium]
MGEILEGRATPAQIAGLLVGLGAKGVTAEELGGMLAAMLARAEGVPVEDGLRWRLVDTCGTG